MAPADPNPGPRDGGGLSSTAPRVEELLERRAQANREFFEAEADSLARCCHAMAERFASVPSPMTAMLLEHFHGAVTRIGPTDTAVPHCEEGWNLLIPSEWVDPAHTEANIAWTKDTYAALSEHFRGGRWLNYLGDDEDDAIRSAYGPNYDRLVEVKRRFDPDNVFHRNHNIVP